MNDKPRAMTSEEMRGVILGHIRSTLEYWTTVKLDKVDIENGDELRHRMNGLVFSILVMFDGGASGIPTLNIIPSPHPSDEEFHKNEGTNWWSEIVINECELHGSWYKTRLKVGDPCPYCGQILVECESCNGGKAEFFIKNMGCMDCRSGYGITCPEFPQNDYEIFGDQYSTRHGCKRWREAY